MRKQRQGFIFLMTLMVMAVISLLVLTSMQHILLYYKVMNRQEELHQHFYQLDELILHLSQEPKCLSPHHAVNQILNQLVHGEGCFLKRGTNEYRYLVEDLGTFPCLVVNQNGVHHATHHHRISLVSLEDAHPDSLLQVRLISVGPVSACEIKTRSIVLGVSSWRYFSKPEDFNNFELPG